MVQDPLQFQFAKPVSQLKAELEKRLAAKLTIYPEERRRLAAARRALGRVMPRSSTEDFFTALGHALPFAAGMVISFSSNDPSNLSARAHQVPAGFMEAVMSWQGPGDPTPLLIERLPAGTSYHLLHTSPERHLRGAPIVEALYPHFGLDLFTDLVVSHKTSGGDQHHRVVTLFHEAGAQAWERIERNGRLLQLLTPDVEAALERLSIPIPWGNELWGRLLAEQQTGLIAATLQGAVVECNARAIRLAESYFPSAKPRTLDYGMNLACAAHRRGTHKIVVRHPREPRELELFVHRIDGGLQGLPGPFLLFALTERVRGSLLLGPHPVLSRLTPRGRDIVCLMVENCWTRRTVAHHLQLSEATVRTHLQRVYRELGVHTWSELLTKLLDPSTRA